MSGKVYMSIFGIGLGHVYRSIGIARELINMGADLVFSSFGPPKYIVMNEFPNKKVYESPKFKIFEESGTINIRKAIKNSLDMLIKFYAGVEIDEKIFKEVEYSVTVSDCQIQSIISSNKLNIPNVFITNILLFPKINYALRIFNSMYKYVLSLTDCVIIPDIKDDTYILPDYDNYNIIWVGPILKRRINEIPDDDYIIEKYGLPDDKDIVLVTTGGSKLMVRDIVSLVVDIISNSFGKDLFPVVVTKHNIPVKYGVKFDYVHDLIELIKVSKLVISHAGHTTISECMCLRKPMVVIPIPDHPEQQVNAKRVENRGIGVRLNPENISYVSMKNAIEKAMDMNVTHYKLADGKGAYRAAKIIKKML